MSLADRLHLAKVGQSLGLTKESLFLLIPSSSEVRGSLNKFPAFFRIGTFIDSTHMKL